MPAEPTELKDLGLELVNEDDIRHCRRMILTQGMRIKWKSGGEEEVLGVVNAFMLPKECRIFPWEEQCAIMQDIADKVAERTQKIGEKPTKSMVENFIGREIEAIHQIYKEAFVSELREEISLPIPNEAEDNIVHLIIDGHLKIEEGKLRVRYDSINYEIKGVRVESRPPDTVVIIDTDKHAQFEYWSSQDEFVPPWRLDWYQLRDEESIRFKDGSYLKSLTKEALKKSGSERALAREIGWDRGSFDRILKEGKGGARVEHLRALLSYLGKPYREIRDEIKAIGVGEFDAIKNPKFPIDLTKAGGLLGACMGDGYLTRSSDGRIRFGYSNTREELREGRS